jgi:hypothetical protein
MENDSRLDARKGERQVNPGRDAASAHGVTASEESEPWCGLLAGAAPSDHIVQLYQDQQFLNRAVCRFAAAAITNGEGV